MPRGGELVETIYLIWFTFSGSWNFRASAHTSIFMRFGEGRCSVLGFYVGWEGLLRFGVAQCSLRRQSHHLSAGDVAHRLAGGEWHADHAVGDSHIPFRTRTVPGGQYLQHLLSGKGRKNIRWLDHSCRTSSPRHHLPDASVLAVIVEGNRRGGEPMAFQR